MLWIWIVISTCLLLFYTALILFYKRGWEKIPVFKPADRPVRTKVSVIIPVRNEEENIARCLESVLSQDYPEDLMEVIIVDDRSEDRTIDIVRSFHDRRLKVIQNKLHENAIAFKKQAIATGISQATGKLIITTDGDCRFGQAWLKSIVSYYETCHPFVIAGPVVYENSKGFFCKFQTLDFLSMVGIGAASISHGFPNMTNGANLAFEKRIFEQVGGYQGNDHIPTGDDIFLVLKIHRHYPGKVAFIKCRDAIVYTDAQPGLKPFLMQRLRWLSKSTQFPDKRITLVLVGAYLFNLSIIVNIFAGIFGSLNVMLITGLSAFGLKSVLDYWFLSGVAPFFMKQDMLRFYLPVQVLHILYVLTVGLLAGRVPYEWKGRIYRPTT